MQTIQYENATGQPVGANGYAYTIASPAAKEARSAAVNGSKLANAWVHFPVGTRFNKDKGKHDKFPMTNGRGWKDYRISDTERATSENFGVVIPDGYIVLDLDTYNGIITKATVERKLACNLDWDAAEMQSTISGGKHYAFKLPDGIKLTTRANGNDRLGLVGLDVKTASKGWIACGKGYEDLAAIPMPEGAWLNDWPVLPKQAVAVFNLCHPDNGAIEPEVEKPKPKPKTAKTPKIDPTQITHSGSAVKRLSFSAVYANNKNAATDFFNGLPADCTPSQFGTRRDALFMFTRYLKTLHPDATKRQLRPYILDWVDHFSDVIRTKEIDENLADFRDSFDNSNIPYGQGVNAIIESLDTIALPALITDYITESRYSTGTEKLIKLCYALKGGSGKFYLSYNDAAKAVGCKSSKTAGSRLMLLVDDELLEVVKKGTRGVNGRATTYRWLADEEGNF